MKGKGLIQFFAIAFIIVCLYQLSFTVVTNHIENEAQSYSKQGLQQYLQDDFLNNKFDDDDKVARATFIDSIRNRIKQRKRQYLDSLRNEVVYDLWFKEYTYQRCKQQEINLGLDLQGGMSVTLEIDMPRLLKAMASNAEDTTFQKALSLAEQKYTQSEKGFIQIFGEEYQRLAPNEQLAVLFKSNVLKQHDVNKYNTNNTRVIEALQQEAQRSIQRTYNIIRTRIDRYGVSQPTVNLQQEAGRIIVELPGVDNPSRVRKLLESTAKLQFWETRNNRDMIGRLSEANRTLRKMKKASDTTGAQQDTAQSDPLLGGGTEPSQPDTTQKARSTQDTSDFGALLGGGDTTQTDTGALAGQDTAQGEMSAQAFQRENPLFSVLNPALSRGQNGQQRAIRGPVVGYSRGKDTAKVNNYLSKPEIRAIFRNNTKFLWGAKPINENNNVYALYAIKTQRATDKAPLEGNVIVDASQDFDRQGNPNVTMNMNIRGAKRWKRLTAENIDEFVAVVLDNRVYSAPRVQQEIAGGRSSITGDFSIEEAKLLANILKAGKLPAPAEIVEEAIVGPTLGAESIRSGFLSLIAGLVMVLVFMILYYNIGGIVSNLALFLNLFFILGVLASLGASLTLPGIAGLVLTVGMAVDANVIIYERIREELEKGKGLRLAIVHGYQHSYSAIADANITTLLTAIILAFFGLGPIKGFATVLIIGIVSSIFTAVLLTQMTYDWMIGRDWNISFSNKLTKGAFSQLDINFISKRKIAYGFSTLIIIISIGAIIMKGFELGVDFKGGRSYVVRFHKSVSTQDVRQSLSAAFGEKPIVKTFGAENQVKITTSYLIDSPNDNADSIATATLYQGLTSFFEDDVSFEKFKDQFRMSSQKVGPTIAEDIRQGAIWATIFGLLVIFLYILLRFRKWQYGLGAIAAIFHDVILVLGLFSLLSGILPFSLEIDQAFIGALLTIIGYSINDTVVIFDRIREFLAIHPAKESQPIINQAMNKTLSRTVMTSVTTLLVVLILFVFGGEVIRGFSFALLIGILTGTYSSLFVATPVMYDLAEWGGKKKK